MTATPATEVETTLNYYLDPTEGGVDHFYVGTVGDKRRRHIPIKTTIENIRGREDDFSLDVQGFKVVHRECAEKTFDDESRIKESYYRDCETLLKEITGATRVHVMNHITRRQSYEEALQAESQLDDMDRSTGPTSAMYVHIDQSYAGALARLHTYLPADAARLTRTRWAIINIWRPIARPVTRKALAVCDARTISDAQLRPVEIRFHRTLPPSQPAFSKEAGESNKENQEPNPALPLDSFTNAYVNKDHVESWGVLPPSPSTTTTGQQYRWYYASGMTPDEAMLFKIFDSRADGHVARRTPHCAFTAPDDHGPTRESLEARCLVFWEDQMVE